MVSDVLEVCLCKPSLWLREQSTELNQKLDGNRLLQDLKSAVKANSDNDKAKYESENGLQNTSEGASLWISRWLL